ncbi:MAG TPA: alpha-amlyase [Marinilabiliales bacterium]|jgi:glycosidase|nr:MAG: hypothetical protein A2W84_15520 [Bacteroidetes bacterium GWC2_40_13]HBO75718.1 alpha-amlyase [Marinilabiliales bacterium]
MKLKLLVIAFLALALQVHAKTDLKKVEPMNWWVGMNNPNLQLLVYGENISLTQPVLSYQGVQVKEIHKVENPNYLFIDLVIGAETQPGKFTIEFKEGKKNVASYKYELKAKNTQPNIHKGFSSSDVVYLLMPDRFSNGDPTNDNHPETVEKANRTLPSGRHGGDLQGVINHLDYIAQTGFTALWLNPFLENNQDAFTYHGYAISDFYKVDPRYGTNALFLELVNQSHQKDIKIIMDMVFNHCGSAHWFIKDLPMKNWIHQHEAYTRSNFRAPVISDPYAAQADVEKMLTGWFDTNMPDLNQQNPFLATYLIQNTIWWVEYAGLDGIRVDTQPYSYKEFMSDWAQAVMAEYPTLNLVGEAWIQLIPNTTYFQGGAKNRDGYDSHMTCVTDFPMHDALNAAFNEKEGWTEGMAKLYITLAQDFAYQHPENLLIFADNHDLNRFYESIGHDLRKFKMAMAFMLTTRGVPQVYYGTEILMDGMEHQGHGFIRKDFPGGWMGDTIDAFSLSGLNPDQADAHHYMKTLLNWRKKNEVIHRGKLMQFIPEDGIYVTFRYTDNKAVMVVLNNNEQADKTIATHRYKEILSLYKTGKEVILGTAYSKLDSLQIPAKSALIIELNK